MHLTLPGERWKEVRRSKGRYRVSNKGRIVSMNYRSRPGTRGRVKIMQPAEDANGYLRTMIKRDGRYDTIKVHRLVAKHWVPNPGEKPQVNHLDGNKLNNRVENLQWVTHRENIDHAVANGFTAKTHGSRNGMAKLTEEDVRQMKRDYVPRKVTQRMLAERYGVSLACIKDIFQGNTWKHVE